MTKAYQATMVASSNVVPSAPVLLNLEDETSVNNGLLLDTPKSVTQSAKEAKKAPVQISKDSDDSSNKKGTKSESKAASTAQSGNSSGATSVAQVDSTSANSAPPEESQSAASAQTQEASATLASVSLDINKLQPEVNKSIIEAISTKVAAVTTSVIPTITVPTSTVNNGFTTDGTSAILYINNSGVIFYKVKVDTNATFTVTDKDSTKEYPLNYGSKLKVNIIQR
jgi:hypothetical protein